MTRRPLATMLASLTLLAGLGATSAPAAHATTSIITIQAPPLAAVNQYNWLTANVTSADSSTRPTGGVQFLNSAGSVIATATLSPGTSPGTATASAPWVPTQLIDYTFTAQFHSTTAGLDGAITSQPTTVSATPNGSMVQISAPQMTLGHPATIVATVYPSTRQGSVSFGANGFPMSASIPIVDGVAHFTFTPMGVGWQRFDVSFSTLGNPNEFGAVSQWVNVIVPPEQP